MKIGDTVYVVRSSGNLVCELEVLSDPVKNIKYCGRLVYKANMLKFFNFEQGWQPLKGKYNYMVKDTHLTKEAAFAALLKVKQETINSANNSIQVAKDSLEYAQKGLKYYQDRLSTLESLNLSAMFGMDTYVSPFTGKIL
jgi:predicted RecB family nuclease